uniref:Uncharacterized protein n=1 Tax=Candidatus Kentrum sp. MB TaxID=2138164 RepID=A0A450X3S6_9GAMM|nr:MAG: hypothetical protein BECKMB1821G_GA0114241_100656 [Candidatus Kentron sp. MB]
MSSSFDLRLYCLSISSISRENRKLSQIAKIAKMIEMTSGPMVAPSEIPLILLLFKHTNLTCQRQSKSKTHGRHECQYEKGQ